MIARIAAVDQPKQPFLWESRRLWSLWDMYRFALGNLYRMLDLLRAEEQMVESRKLLATQKAQGIASLAHALAGTQPAMEEDEVKHALIVVGMVRGYCIELELDASQERIDRIENDLSGLWKKMTYDEYAAHLRTLLETIEDRLQNRWVHYYPAAFLKPVKTLDVDWKPTLESFPSAKPDIEDAANCYARGFPTAAVFHLMRASEFALRAFARERGVTFPRKPIEWAAWQEILTKIEQSVTSEWGNASSGPAKDAALGFYRGALGQFHAFKDEYRNAVMHVRERYDDHQALKAMDHVRHFMNGLSVRLNEKTRKGIRRWP